MIQAYKYTTTPQYFLPPYGTSPLINYKPFTFSDVYNTHSVGFVDIHESTARICSCEVILNYINFTGNCPSMNIYFGTQNKEILLWSGSTTDNEFAWLQNGTIVFTDKSIIPISRVCNMPVPRTLDSPPTFQNPIIYVQPAEPLFNLSTADSGGIFKLRLESSDPNMTTFNGTLNWGMNVNESNSCPLLPPVYTINTTTGLLNLSYPQMYVSKAIRIEMSPHLMRMFSFGSQSRQFDSLTKRYRLLFPSLSLTHPMTSSNLTNGNNIITWTQMASTKYRLNNIDRILVVGRNIEIAGEIFDNFISKNTIADFSVNNEVDLHDLMYSFEGSVVPFRRYALTSDRPFQEISFDIYASYIDGSLVKILLSPGTNMELKILFIPKN